MSGLRLDTKLVNEPFRAGQAFAQAAARRKAVAHGVFYIGDARPLVLEDEAKALAPARGFRGLSYEEAAARVFYDIARKFRRDCGEPRLVNQPEADCRGDLSHLAARHGNVVVCFERD